MEKLVFITADWCTNCTIVKQWIKESGITTIEEYDSDEDSKNYIERFKVKSIPMIIRLDENENEINRVVGNFSGNKQEFLNYVNN